MPLWKVLVFALPALFSGRSCATALSPAGIDSVLFLAPVDSWKSVALHSDFIRHKAEAFLRSGRY